jgi:hypothetical protein
MQVHQQEGNHIQHIGLVDVYIVVEESFWHEEYVTGSTIVIEENERDRVLKFILLNRRQRSRKGPGVAHSWVSLPEVEVPADARYLSNHE